MSRHVGIAEQLFERAEAEQFVDQHLFQRELLAPVEGDLQLGQHFQMIGRNSSDSSSLVSVAAASGSTRSSRRGSTCSLILWTEASKPLALGIAGFADVLAVGKARHRIAAAQGVGPASRHCGIDGQRSDRRELVAAGQCVRRAAPARRPSSGAPRRTTAGPLDRIAAARRPNALMSLPFPSNVQSDHAGPATW